MSTINNIYFFSSKLQANLLDLGRNSTARSYMSAIRSFFEFTGNEGLTFGELTPRLLKDYEQYLYNKGCKSNTVSLYMRMLRSICNQAAKQEGVELAPDLFKEVFTGSQSCHKRAVSPTVIQRLYELDLDDCSSFLSFSRDLFLLSFYLRGIPFVDLCLLRKRDISGNILTYRRSKTGRELTVCLEPCALSLLRKYASLVKGSPYLLPLLRHPGVDEYRQYQSALRLYNLHLGKLSKLLGLKESLTSYVARHSWATAAYHKGIPVAVISESLGHSSEKVTYNYLGSFDHRILKQANRKVLSLIFPRGATKRALFPHPFSSDSGDNKRLL
ncbi:site-specific integrase [uncultured Bacteroides sp.]|uniref:tyrosine-type recombinase/integrase n=1 Tax=uncultured Bacteroides sp. TaxID=162156 RepID=UPI002AAAF0A1|nr:site-specific integrase [uncultured Bacteroides sp.]